MKKLSTILVLNGPNLNLLGLREKSFYGNKTLEDINLELNTILDKKYFLIDFFQSNNEGELIEKIHEAINICSGLIINAGAYTHTSVALLDALKIFDKPIIEVHMSNIYGRDNFRRKSYISLVADGSICGFGHLSYRIALNSITKMMGYSNN